MVTIESDVTFKGQRFFGGELGFSEHGGFVVSLFTTPPPEPRGKYMTVVPISNLNYRRKHGNTKTWFSTTEDSIVLADDYGSRYTIGLTDKAVVSKLAQECVDNEIPLIA